MKPRLMSDTTPPPDPPRSAWYENIAAAWAERAREQALNAPSLFVQSAYDYAAEVQEDIDDAEGEAYMEPVGVYDKVWPRPWAKEAVENLRAAKGALLTSWIDAATFDRDLLKLLLVAVEDIERALRYLRKRTEQEAGE